MTLTGVLDRAMQVLMAVSAWLVLPVTLLLFLQWPLRDLLHRWSVQANDLAQWMFALYVAAAVTQATRRHTHLAIEGFSHRFAPHRRTAIARAGALLAILPWAGFLIATGLVPVWHAVRGLEAFPETGDPGYFLVKAAMLLLAVLLAVQAALDTRRKQG